MENITKYINRKYITVWLMLILLIASGTGAAVGSVIAGKVTGDISVTTAGSAGGLLIGAPICDTIVHSVDEALEVSGNDVDPVINTWPPGFGFSDITNLDKLAFSDDIYQTTAASALRASQHIYRFYVGDGDNIDKLVVTWEGYGEISGTLRVYDNTGAVWGMAEPIDTTDSTLTIKITGTTDIDISEAVNSTGYVYVQAYLSAVDNSLFADYVNIAATYSAIDWSNWAGFTGPEVADREFSVPGRCIGVRSDDQTGFEAASELGVGDWWMFMLPIKNAGNADIAAKLTLDVPGCLNVYIMTPDEVGHASPRITDAVRSGANTWRFLVDADAEKQDDADYLYVMINAHDDCGPGYFTITGTIESVSFEAHLTEPVPVVTGVTSVASIVDGTGTFTESVYPQSADGNVMLSIPAGTVGLDGGGDPLSEIIISGMASPPPPPADGSIIGLTYTLGPSGATFVPPIRITFTYDPADIPPGVLEANLKLAWWDETIGDWVVLANIVVDTVNKTISADVSHFTPFTSLGFKAPTVETSGHTALTAISATLNGNLTDLGDSPNVDLYFEWGTDTAYGNTIAATPASTSTTGAFRAALSNLTPLTTYHFRAKADGGNHGIVYGADMSFTTPEVCQVNTNAADNLTGLSANLNGALTSFNLPAGYTVVVGFELGASSENYSLLTTTTGTIGTMGSTGAFSLDTYAKGLSLTPETTYYCRAFAYDGATNTFFYGAELTFTTPAMVTLVTNAAADITGVSVNMTGTITGLSLPAGHPGIGVGFELLTTADVIVISNSLYTGPVIMTGPYSFTSYDVGALLTPETDYKYRAFALDPGTGLYYYGEYVYFTTPVLATVETTAANNITAVSANMTGNLTALNIPTIYPGIGVGFELGTDTNYTLLHGIVGILPNLVHETGPFSFSTYALGPLSDDTTYHYRAFAYDPLAGVFYYGADMTFTTPVLATVITTAANNITAVTANLTGEITSVNVPASFGGVYYGFELGTDTGYTLIHGIAGVASMTPTTTPLSFSVDTFVMGLPLSPSTTYHYRAWAYNGLSFYYGADMTFTTPALGMVTTGAADNITALSADCHGEVTNLSVPAGYPGVIYGFEVGRNSGNYDMYDTTTGMMGITGEGAFSGTVITIPTITNFQLGDTYYYRAFITDGTNYYYGGEMSFTTSTEIVVMTTNDPDTVTATSANLNGEVTSLNMPVEAITAMGGSIIIPVGFELDLADDGTVVLDYTTGYVGMLSAVGPYSLSTGTAGVTLQSGTNYRYRAIGIFPLGSDYIFSYGEYKYFTTP